MKNGSSKNDVKEHGDEGMDNDLHELFLDELADMLSAEKQLTKALPKMQKAAQSDELKEAIQAHLEETEEHVSRLEEVFSTLDEEAKSKTCKAMKGLLEEGSELLEELEGKNSLDAGIIAAAQKVEHYEIASYGTVIAWAEQMGHLEAAELLKETLQEEKAANDKLTKIASEEANQHAEQ